MPTQTGTFGNDYLIGLAYVDDNRIYGDIFFMDSGLGGNDTLIGGANAINFLYGDANEIVSGVGPARGGNDTLIGGENSADNVLYGDAYQLSSSTGGDDTLTGGANSEFNVLYGDADTMTIYGNPGADASTGGNDSLTGGANSYYNTLIGDGGRMYASSIGGDDTLTGGANSTYNTLYGDGRTMQDSTGGNDALVGGANSNQNTLAGDAYEMYSSVGGSDTVTGGAGGTNFMYGDSVYAYSGSTGGNDRLVSADNTTDYMWGDFGSTPDCANTITYGNDTFVFTQNSGNDFINDFQQGRDIVELKGFFREHIPEQALAHVPERALNHLLESFKDLNIQTTDVNSDGKMDSVIHFDTNNTVTVYNVHHLTASDFHFVF
jgi:hypothetical protein